MYGVNGMSGVNGMGSIYGYPSPTFPTSGAYNGFNGQGSITAPGYSANGYTGQQGALQGNQELVPVQTVDQVEQVQVQPGQRRIVMVQNEPVIAARIADNMGLVTTQYYQLTPYDPHTVSSDVSAQNYITEEQFDQRLEKRLASFAESLKTDPAPAKEEKKGASSK